MQYGYETFQNVASVMHSVICCEMNIDSITRNRLLKKKRGIFSLQTVTFYYKKVLQFII